ncbi:MAG: hypothetical protein J7M24_00985 [Candidatus Latescibacteria bacterium]|nr:hypothetical protein [Candidatus Latescibacterota bacterium]
MNGKCITAGIICTLAIMIWGADTQADPQGGIFIPRNGGYEGFIGESHVFIDAVEGGVIEIVKGKWPALETLARAEMSFEVAKSGRSGPVPVRQSFDRSPEIIFIEEGNDRTGVRVKCRLYDDNNCYHGFAMTETWLYPEGEMFFAAAASFEDSLSNECVTDARLSICLSDRYTTVTPGLAPRRVMALGTRQELPFNDAALPGRNVLFSGVGGADIPAIAFAWRTGRQEPYQYLSRRRYDESLRGAPSYFRWPAFLRQQFPGIFRDGKTVGKIVIGRERCDFVFFDGDAGLETPTVHALLRFIIPADGDRVRNFVEAERRPLALAVEGGVIHENMNKYGYKDQEGVYQVRKTGNPVSITLPADPLKRIARIKVICLDGYGAVAAKVDGRAVVPHLASEGGIHDDPLAPIREAPEGPADMAYIPVRLTDRPRVLTVSGEEGVQLAYQTRDQWRNVMCFTSHGGRRWSSFRFSLADGRARYMRKYGAAEWALTENMLHWFPSMGYTPLDMMNQLRDFVILKNGPGEAVFRYTSANANDRAISEYTVQVPYDSPAMQYNVSARFTVKEGWHEYNNQHFDIFPFRGVEPKEWWYQEALMLAADGRMKWQNVAARTWEGDTKLHEFSGPGFFALYSSERGNMLMLAKRFDPEFPVQYSICGNYIDYHMMIRFMDEKGELVPPRKGFELAVDYELALYGDGRTTREEITAIGEKSLAAGRLVLP